MQINSCRWRKKRYAMVCSWALSASMVSWSGPQNGRVVDGSADIHQENGNTRINQHSSRVFIEYDDFSIGANESVQFIQPNSQAIAVNRVTGENLSEILGSLDANGKVFLINPNGVLFGENASVNVSGLVVSTLDNIGTSDGDTLSLSRSGSGKIENRADIHIDDVGGYLALISPNILNHGELKAQEIDLVSADYVIVQLGEHDLGIEIQTASLSGFIANNGVIEGNKINLRSHIQDQINSAVIENNGEIRATGFELVDGEIHISSQSSGDIVNHGTIVSEGISGGQVTISGERVLHHGNISADGRAGGGDVDIDGQNLIYLGSESEISANAIEHGDGGSIINFSPRYTIFEKGAEIAALGGQRGGNGGFVEVSGIEFVSALGLVDTRAPMGQAGIYYIDPTDIEIGDFGGATNGGSFNVDGEWVPAGDTSQIDAGDLVTQLSTNATVLIDTNNPAGNGVGNITVSDTIDFNGTGDSALSLSADNSIIFDGGQIIDSVAGGDNLNLNFNAANGNIDLRNGTTIETGTTGRLSLTANAGQVIMPDGDLALLGEFVVSSQDMLSQSGRVSSVTANSVDIDLSGPAGDLTVNANTPLFSASIDSPASLTVNLSGQSATLGSNGVSLNQGNLALNMLGSGNTLNINNIVTVNSGNIAVTNGGGPVIISSGLTSNDGEITLSSTDGNLTINNPILAATGISATTTNGQLTISNTLTTGSGDINLVADGQMDISNDITTNDGNISLLANGGDLNINGTVSAADNNDDEVRTGLIDITVSDGNFNLINNTIASTNTVDNDVDGGLGSQPTNQVAIRIRNTSTDGNVYNITLGDNTNNDTLVSAQGGDIYIDARSEATTPGVLTLNSDVTIQSYDTDPTNAVAVTVGPNVVNNGATVIAEPGRRVLVGEGDTSTPTPTPTPATPTPTPTPATPTPTPAPPTPTPTPLPPTPTPSPEPPTPTPTVEPSPTPMPATPEPTPQPTPTRGNILDDEISDSIQDDTPKDEDSGAKGPDDGNPGGSGAPSGIDALFRFETNNCDAQLDETEKNRCFKHAEMKKFLNLLFIGGELPEASSE